MPSYLRSLLATLLVVFLPFSGVFSQASAPVATVQTDKPDYLPGEYVHITGAGWEPGEVVQLTITHSTVTHGSTVLYDTADASGNISNHQFLILQEHLGEVFYLTATGLNSGQTATTMFTDGDSFRMTVSPTTVGASASQVYTIRITNNTTTNGDPSSKKIGSVEIQIPAGYSGFPPTFGTVTVSNNTLVSPITSTTGWTPLTTNGYTNGYKSVTQGPSTTHRLALVATSGSFELQIGDWVEFQVTLTNPAVTTSINWNVSATAFAGSQNVALSGNQYPIDNSNSTTTVSVVACSAPSVTGQPSAQNITYGSNASFSVTSPAATGFQWQVSSNGSTGWADLANGGVYSGVTTSTLSLTLPPASMNGLYYRCRVANCTPAQTANSNAAQLSVGQRSITITAGNQSKEYGDLLNLGTSDFSITSGTMYGSETIASVTLTSSGAAAAAGATTYSIVPSAATAGLNTTLGNYAITYANGTLTVNKAPITVTADPASRAYGDANPSFTASYSGYKNGENFASSGINGTPALSSTATTATGVGSATITAAIGTLTADNYSFSFVNGTLTITARAITVTADPQTKVYGAADPALTYQVTSGSLANSDGFSGALSRTAGENVGARPIGQGNLSLSSNYNLSFVGANLTITAADLTIKADNQSKVYNNQVFSGFTVSYTGFVNGDDEADLSGTLAFSGAATTATTVGSHTITPGGLTSSNYNIIYQNGTLSITARPITVTADAKSKTYGAADPGFTYQVTTGSVASGDAFSGTLTRVSGEDFGTYAIQQGSLALNSNYNLTYVGADLTINKRAITITAGNQSKTYGQNHNLGNANFSITTGTMAPSESIASVTLTSAGSPASASVTTYTIVASAAVGAVGTDVNNYSITYLDGVLTVNKKTLTVTAENKSRTYGEANPALTVSYDGFENGESASALSTAPTAATSATAASPVGGYAIVPSGGVAGNYSFNYVNGTLTITARAITVTADAQTKVYGAADPALTYQITAGSLANSDAFSGSISRTGGEGVGSYPIGQGTLTLSSNYDLNFVGANLTITKAALNVTANNQSKVYDNQVFTAFTVTYSGFVNGDDEGDLGGVLAYSGAATTATAVGSHTITPGGLTSANYTIAFHNGTLSITARPITITADAKSKVYGDGDPSLTYQITSGSLAAGDAITGSLSRLPGENFGTYAIQQGSVAINSNYNLTYVGANLSIDKRAITITAGDRTKTYGDVLTLGTSAFSTSNLASGESIASVTLSSDGAAAGAAVGSYDVVPGNAVAAAGTLLTNYTITYNNGTLTVGTRAITVKANPQTKVYGTADPALTYAITAGALANGDTWSGTLSRETGNNVGAYAIQRNTLALSSNYTVTYVGDNLTITARPITITAGNQSKTYGQEHNLGNSSFSITTGTMASSESIASVTLTSAGAAAAAGVGNYPIVPSAAVGGAGTDVTNYDITYANGNLAVGKKTLTVTAEDKSRSYGDANPPFTVVYSGFENSDNAASLTTAPTATTTATAATSVGTYAIVPAGGVSANYSFNYVNGTLTIGRRAIRITAGAKTKVYGDADPALTFAVTTGSLANGDALTGSLTRESGQNVGTYAINQGTVTNANNANYDISYVGADLTITKKALTVTAANKSKTYDGAVFSPFTVTYSAFAYSENETSLGGTLSFGGNAVTAVNAGTYTITPSGITSGNYDISFVNGTLTINKLTVTITPTSGLWKTYSCLADPVFTYSHSPALVAGDAFTGALSRTAGDNVGTFAINLGTLGVQSTGNNYTLVLASPAVTFEIKPQPASPISDVLYTGPGMAWTSTSSSNTATVTLSATFRNSISCGDVRTGRVTFGIRGAGNSFTPIPGAQNLMVNYIDPSNPSQGGAVAATVQLSISGSAVAQTFNIAVIVTGNYTANNPQWDGLVTVAKPTPGGLITGNADLCHSAPSNTTGFVKGAATTPSGAAAKSKVSFYVTYNKSLTNMQGGVELHVPSYYLPSGQLDPANKLHWYKFKSTAINTLAINRPEAQFSAKANMAEVMDDGTEVSIEGNCVMQMDLKDGSLTSPATADLVGIVIYRKAGGVWYANNWNNTLNRMEKIAICGGEISVSGTGGAGTSGMQSRNTEEFTTERSLPELKLDASVFPNPSESQFSLKLQGGKAPITIRVVDAFGRVVETRNNLFAGQLLQFGASYKAGIYFVEVIQGKEKKTLRISKM